MGNNQSQYDGNTIQGMVECTDYRVVVGIKVINNTSYDLKNGRAVLEWGYLQTIPDRIAAQDSGILISHKNAVTFTGTSGVASWQIGDKQKRLVVMWSAPYNFDFHENVLAVGFGLEHPSFNSIYTLLNSNSNDYMDIGKYYHGSRTLEAGYENLTVNGIMGTAHKAVATISLNIN